MTPAAELHRTEQLLMKWPRSPRLAQKVQELRRLLAHQREAKARALRGEIRRRLMGADVDTLAQLAQSLRSAS